VHAPPSLSFMSLSPLFMSPSPSFMSPSSWICHCCYHLSVPLVAHQSNALCGTQLANISSQKGEKKLTALPNKRTKIPRRRTSREASEPWRCSEDLGCSTGNPRVAFGLPIPLPTSTRTRNPRVMGYGSCGYGLDQRVVSKI